MASRKPSQTFTALLPRSLRKHWPALRGPYLFSLFLLSILAVKLALFTPAALPPPLPDSSHSTASASVVAAQHPSLTTLSKLRSLPHLNGVAPPPPVYAHTDEQPQQDDADEGEKVDAEIRPIDGDKNAERNVDAAPQAPATRPEGSTPGCVEYIVYDKPVKTGSTAVRDALLSYFATRGAEYVACTFENCNAAAERILSGSEPKRNLVEHLLGQDGLVERLGEYGYYKATSIRDPKSRWESAFRYNRAKKARHYGIGPDVSYEEFMARMPPCSLYDFYDHQGGACGDKLEERIKKIVYRYHEIIDLYDEKPAGQLHMRLMPYLAVSNKSPETMSDGGFDESRLENETKLYNALKKRRLELHGHEPVLC